MLFRPEENALRMKIGADRMCMPSPTIEQFIDVVKKTVLANKKWISNSKLDMFILPENDFLFMPKNWIIYAGTSAWERSTVYQASASGNWLKAGSETSFRVHILTVCFPNYHKGDMNLIIEDKVCRATPGGTGGIKAVTNYSPANKALTQAKAKGFSDVLFLDALTGRYIEEGSTCNVFILKGNVISTPTAHGTILPGITRKSIIEIA